MDFDVTSTWSSVTSYFVSMIAAVQGMDGNDWLLVLSGCVALVRLVIDAPKAYDTIRRRLDGRTRKDPE